MRKNLKNLSSLIFLFNFSLCLSMLGCKKENTEKMQTIPAPFYFQMANVEGEEGMDISKSKLKIWYVQHDVKIFVDNIKPIAMKVGEFKYGMMSQDMSMLSAFKNVKTFYLQIDDQVTHVINLDVNDLGETQDLNAERFVFTSVRFNQKEIEINKAYLPGLWILK